MSDLGMSAELVGGKEMIAAFKKAGAFADEKLAEAINLTLPDLRGKAKDNAPVFTGNLRRSIHADFATSTKPEGKVGTDANYALALEEGTKPFYPNMTGLKIWALRKFGNANIAYPVAKNISKRGIQKREFFKKARTDANPLWIKNVDNAISSIVNFLATG